MSDSNKIVAAAIEAVFNALTEEVQSRFEPALWGQVDDRVNRTGYNLFMEWIGNYTTSVTFRDRVTDMIDSRVEAWGHSHLFQFAVKEAQIPVTEECIRSIIGKWWSEMEPNHEVMAERAVKQAVEDIDWDKVDSGEVVDKWLRENMIKTDDIDNFTSDVREVVKEEISELDASDIAGLVTLVSQKVEESRAENASDDDSLESQLSDIAQLEAVHGSQIKELTDKVEMLEKKVGKLIKIIGSTISEASAGWTDEEICSI